MSGLKICLMGEPGTGKTHAIATLALSTHIDRIFVLFTDPGGDSTLRKAIADIGVPIAKFHWRYIASVAPSWSDLIDGAKKVNQLSNEALQKLDGLGRQSYTQFIDLLSQMANFRDELTGKTFGEVDSLTERDVLCIDTLSGLNDMTLRLKVGAKPIRSQPDWGAAMDMEENFIHRLVYSLKCHVVLNAHVETEPDAITGSSRIMISMLGRKLAPKLPRLFDELLLAKRDGTRFIWSTAAPNAVVKTRHLPFSDTLPPDFSLLLDQWAKHRTTPPPALPTTVLPNAVANQPVPPTTAAH